MRKIKLITANTNTEKSWEEDLVRQVEDFINSDEIDVIFGITFVTLSSAFIDYADNK